MSARDETRVEERTVLCGRCSGFGEIAHAHPSGRPDWDAFETCRECGGTGDAVAADAFDAIVRELIAPHGDVDPDVLELVSVETGVATLALEASLARTGATL